MYCKDCPVAKKTVIIDKEYQTRGELYECPYDNYCREACVKCPYENKEQ